MRSTTAATSWDPAPIPKVGIALGFGINLELNIQPKSGLSNPKA